MPLLIGRFGKQYALGIRADNGKEGLVKTRWESEPNPEKNPELYYAVVRINPAPGLYAGQKPDIAHVDENTVFYFFKLLGNIPQLCSLVALNRKESRGEFCVYGEEFEEDGGKGKLEQAVYAYTAKEIVDGFQKKKIAKCLFVDDWIIKSEPYDGENLFGLFSDPDFNKSPLDYCKWMGNRKICQWCKKRYPDGLHKEYLSDALMAKRIDANTLRITVDGKKEDRKVLFDGKGAEYIRGGGKISKSAKAYLHGEQLAIPD